MSSFRQLMLERLLSILKCEPADVPAVFKMPGRRPLKIGIDADLIARFPHADAGALAGWMKWWTLNRAYVVTVIEDGDRYDLDGHPVQKVTAGQAKHAAKMIGSQVKPMVPPERPMLTLPKISSVGTPAKVARVAKPAAAKVAKPARAVVGRASSPAIEKEVQVGLSIRNAVEASADRAFIERLLARARR
jgi:sRNA-binding protein